METWSSREMYQTQYLITPFEMYDTSHKCRIGDNRSDVLTVVVICLNQGTAFETKDTPQPLLTNATGVQCYRSGRQTLLPLIL